MLQVKQNVLTLKGITLRGSIQLYNPNENLAVIFEIQSPTGFEICIQPKRGIVMQQQIKIVKAWVKDQDRQRVVMANFAGKSLKINCTMRTQYNRKIFIIQERLNLQGWERAKQSFETIQIPIIISSQAKNIRSQIQYQVSNSMNKISNSRESIGSKYKQQFKVGKSYSQVREQPETNRKRINEKLDRQLDYLFESQESKKGQHMPKYGQGEYVEYLKENQGYSSRNKGDLVTYQPLRQARNNKIPLKNANGTSQSAQNQRFLEIIMLAALAGFFVALGSNFKHLFK